MTFSCLVLFLILDTLTLGEAGVLDEHLAALAGRQGGLYGLYGRGMGSGDG